MKTKSSKRLIISFAVFAVGILVCLPLRTYQLSKLIESSTGFWFRSQASNFTIPLLYTILAVATVAIIVNSLVKSGLTSCISGEKNILLAVVSFIFAVTLVIDAATQAINVWQIFSEFNSLRMTNYTLATYFNKCGGYALIIESVFAAFSAVFFAIFGMNNLKLFGSLSRFKFLALTPLLWAIGKIVYRFIITIRFLNVSEILFELFMLVFAILFFFNFARVVSNLDAESAAKKLLPYGLPAALFALVVSAPRLICLITGMKSRLVDGYPFSACDFAMALFIVIFLLSSVKSSAEIENSGDEETLAEADGIAADTASENSAENSLTDNAEKSVDTAAEDDISAQPEEASAEETEIPPETAQQPNSDENTQNDNDANED